MMEDKSIWLKHLKIIRTTFPVQV